MVVPSFDGPVEDAPFRDLSPGGTTIWNPHFVNLDEYTIVDVVAADDSERESESWAQPCLPGNGSEPDGEPASGEARSPNRRWSRVSSVRTPVLSYHVHDEQQRILDAAQSKKKDEGR